MADAIHDFGDIPDQLEAQIAEATQHVNQLTQELEQTKDLLNRLQASKSALYGEPVSLLATAVLPGKKRKYVQLPENRPLKIAAQHLRRAKERDAPKAEIAKLEKERDDAQAALRAAKLKKKE